MKQKLIMRHISILLISLTLVLTGCSDEVFCIGKCNPPILSPEEKRNKFDKCVLDKYKSQFNKSQEQELLEAKLECKELLD